MTDPSSIPETSFAIVTTEIVEYYSEEFRSCCIANPGSATFCWIHPG
jgi:hypothetical protein